MHCLRVGVLVSALGLAACVAGDIARRGLVPSSGAAAPGAAAVRDDRPVWQMPQDPAQLASKFAFSDPDAWRVGGADDNDGAWLELFTRSDYRPPVRSPLNIALVGGLEFSDFTLEAELMQTGREYGHRDLCLFFGFQSPSRYYYVHLATAADPHAHNVFVVNDAPRTAIAARTTDGIDWGHGVWKRVKIERRVDAGTIRVFFEDMETPIMEATDATFGAGMLGFGSFDDTGRIRNLRIRGAAPRARAGGVGFPN